MHRDQNSTSFLISAVGDLSKVSFKCPLNDKPVIFEKRLEIITLSGYIRSSDSHIHISASDENCSVFGGHLLSGTIVHKSLDVLIGVIPNLNKTSISSSRHVHSTVDIYILPDCPWWGRPLLGLQFQVYPSLSFVPPSLRIVAERLCAHLCSLHGARS